MTRMLSESTLPLIAGTIRRPNYDRRRVHVGIAHIGPGIFHRGHQAAYIDDVLTRECNWAICGISLNSANLRDTLRQQDFLYTLSIPGSDQPVRIIGAIQTVLAAQSERRSILRVLASPNVKIVSLTITEKGYCLDPAGNLDVDHPAIQTDLLSPSSPISAIGYITEGLRLRRSANIPPFTVLSCDNLPSNGRKLAKAVQKYAALRSPDLANWIEAQVRFPCTMVDSITPATDDALRRRVGDALSVTDNWPVQREPFSQWVIEDDFGMGRPDWEPFGVTMTGDVRPFELAKLRLLNGPHSAMAYLGLLAGFETIDAVLRNGTLKHFLRDMMTKEIFPTLSTVTNFNLPHYRDKILHRLENTAIKHSLSQIAQDGSQKLPVRILAPIMENLRDGLPITRLSLVVAAWIRFIHERLLQGHVLLDPLAEALAAVIRYHEFGDPSVVDAIVAMKTIFPGELAGRMDFKRMLRTGYVSLGNADRTAIQGALERIR